MGKQHRRIQKKIAGKKGKVEIPISRKRKIDVQKGRKVVEIERSGDPKKISQALNRLKAKKGLKKEIRVPQKDLNKTKDIAKKKKMSVIIKNLSGTKIRSIKRK
ncbi:hypothetical protein ES703_54427 [subsurface metagenome]